MSKRRLLGYLLVTLILLGFVGFLSYIVGQKVILDYNWNTILAYSFFLICCTGIFGIIALLYWCFKE